MSTPHQPRVRAARNDAPPPTTPTTDAAVPRKRGPRPGTEAARRGGLAARARHGSEFYRKIGAQGGQTVRERHGSSFYADIGRRGGESTKRNRGLEHYAEIGRIGGRKNGKRHAAGPGAADAPPAR